MCRLSQGAGLSFSVFGRAGLKQQLRGHLGVAKDAVGCDPLKEGTDSDLASVRVLTMDLTLAKGASDTGKRVYRVSPSADN